MNVKGNTLSPLILKRKLRSFDPQNQQSTPQNALFLATAAACAYHASKKEFWAPEVFSDHGFSDFQYFSRNWRGTEGFCMSSHDAIVISFCGTNELRDWFTNFETKLKKVYGVFVHEGFWKGLNVVWVGRDQLYRRLQEESKTRRVWITGHSLGGALAMVAALRCIAAGIPVQGVYTFGQPLVGEGRFKNILAPIAHCIHRYVNEADPIPLMPLRGKMQLPRSQWKVRFIGKRRRALKTKTVDFEDIGQLYWFDENGKLIQNADFPTRSVSFIKGLYQLVRGTLQLPQHDLQRYINNIAGTLPPNKRSPRRNRTAKKVSRIA